ncbi:winged helix-turn-helix transcriptional regulator [Desulfoplanes formicivorans]|uniref:HxlR family transcriptional regulator n=1 Tax=Desulfoplanes formicivorans TaxID=1592317 RepID=A0A194AHS1_9BACT|nr:helix-turn-helix domain-containing protein [Desulfoplanes formicivorans]GAU08765.1 HxlR family transcriptional regulator [Desulfoplanes formicivorans]
MTSSNDNRIAPCKVKTLGKRSYRCYFELTLSIIGGKWKPIILYHLGIRKVLRFGQLRRTMPEITERMLTRQLRELESDGMVRRTVYPTSPPRVEYSLTGMGTTILPLLHAMRAWGVACERQLGGEGLFPPEDGYEDPDQLPC